MLHQRDEYATMPDSVWAACFDLIVECGVPAGRILCNSNPSVKGGRACKNPSP